MACWRRKDMLHIVRKLPKHVELSQHLREQTAYYIGVQSLGITYYVPATPEIRDLLELDGRGRDARRDRRRRWTNCEKADALRDIVAALSLQARDVELAGIERNVTDALLDRMRGALHATVRKSVEAERAKKALTA